MQTTTETQPSTSRAALQFAGKQRDPLDELLYRADIAKPFDEGGFAIPVATQCCWFQTNRYGWRAMCIKLGSKVVIRRRDLEGWLNSRKGLVQEPASIAARSTLATATKAKVS